MKALVTGGTGFIGSHLVQKLIAEGWEVHMLIRPSKNRREELPLKTVLVEGELLNDSSLVSAVGNVDYVFHVGGVTYAPTREKYTEVNSIGTQNLINACRSTSKRVRRFVYISSLAVMGPNPSEIPWKESDMTRPITWYGESKLAGENFVREIGGQFQFSIIRPPIVFGPRDKGIYKIFKFINYGIQPILGFPESLYSLIFVEDLVDGIVKVAQSPQAEGQTFFLTMEKPSGWEELGNIAAKYLEKKPLRVYLTPGLASLFAYVSETFSFLRRSSVFNRQKVLEIAQRHWICSGEKAKNILGWEPRFSLEPAIQKTIHWYKTNGWL